MVPYGERDVTRPQILFRARRHRLGRVVKAMPSPALGLGPGRTGNMGISRLQS